MNIHFERPSPKEYIELRQAAGHDSKDEARAERALGRSIASLTVRDDGSKLIGMARVIGDGAYYFQIVDLTVAPEYRDTGLERKMMAELADYLTGSAPKGSEAILMADVPSIEMYKTYGFEFTYPNSISLRKML
ncbi:GNAT family N-acetyltransferase [Paenibacillus flagellatus]|uniref:GNAT family N-acetyltransferase n=1 Tax=Paenibacillus flagellatus TaxID=2211139 RepID=A0A2V5K8X7_9BACL|nr:GNAT family N-acetyltransferase [Paenibacillus flagellatus]PYI55961.1 GNAT family N-acetyltransferase [Paenibacillus flagellatus]